jgi:hypothetical protein
MQLQNRTIKGRSMVRSPNAVAASLRPATAGTPHRAPRDLLPPRPGSSQALQPGAALEVSKAGSSGASSHSGSAGKGRGATSQLEEAADLPAARPLPDPAGIVANIGADASSVDCRRSYNPGAPGSSLKAGGFASSSSSNSFGFAGEANPLWEAGEPVIEEGVSLNGSLVACNAMDALPVAACGSPAIPQTAVAAEQEGAGALGSAAAPAGQETLDELGGSADAYSTDFEGEQGSRAEAAGPAASAGTGSAACSTSPEPVPVQTAAAAGAAAGGGGAASVAAASEPLAVMGWPPQQGNGASLALGSSSALQQGAAPRGSPRVGTTRSYQLKVRAAQEGVASGRYATAAERASATEQELRDMALLCSSPKRRGAAAQASSACDPLVGNFVAGQQAAHSGQGIMGSPSGSAEGELGSAAAAIGMAVPGVGAGVSSQATAPTQPATKGLSSAEDGSLLANCEGEPGSDASECYGIAVPVHKEGLSGLGSQGACDSPQSTVGPAWKLGTEVTLHAGPRQLGNREGGAQQPAQSSPPGASPNNEERQGRQVGSPLPAAAGAPPGGGSGRGSSEGRGDLEERRWVPMHSPLP